VLPPLRGLSSSRTISAKRVRLIHIAASLKHCAHLSFAGKPVSHAFAKELLAGFVGGEVDKLAETKGEDAWDHHEARKHAEQSAERMYDEHYIDDQGADQYNPNEYERPPRFNRY